MTAPTAPQMVGSREAAIEASGAAERFHLIQLRNPAFWVLAWGVVAGAIRLFTYYQPGTGNYGGALVGGTVAFAVYTIFWLIFLHWMDRYTPVRPGLLATGFVWGAVAATLFIALAVNTAMLDLYAKWFGTTWAQDWAAGSTAPLTEETAKAIGFVLLLGLAPRLIRSAYDAFIVGAFIGLGFEVSEDILYAYQGAGQHFATGQAGDTIKIIVLRSGSGLVSHAAFSALVCCGIFWILGRDPRGRHVAKGLLLIVVAMILHGSWDVAAALGILIGGLTLAAYMIPLLLIIGIVLVLIVGKDAGVTERRWAHDILEPEVALGILSEAEVAAVAGTHKARKRYIKSEHGHRNHKTAKHVIEAGRELCAELARSGGVDTDEVVHARSEVAHLRT